MTKHFIAIAPANLAIVWPEIRNEVAEIERPDGFIPEDVYSMLKGNGATLFFIMDGEKRVGWMVCRLMQPDLHIWQLHAENGYNVMTEYRDQLMQLARDANATTITFGSTRKAWAQVAKTHGFSMRMIVYSCPVDPAPQPTVDQSNKPEVAAE